MAHVERFSETHVRPYSCLTVATADANLRRMMLRPTELDTPDLFQLIASGRELGSLPGIENLDFAYLASHPPDLVRWLRQVIGQGRGEELTINVDWVSEYRPSSRMVNKFGEGRVFVAGGMLYAPPTASNRILTLVNVQMPHMYTLLLVARCAHFFNLLPIPLD
jgi:hypothetical protein